MQMLNLKKVSKKLKKSQMLLLGSLLIFIGLIVIGEDYFSQMKNEVISKMKVESGMNDMVSLEDDGEITDVPVVENLNEEKVPVVTPTIDYSKYLGVLEIPKIGLKRGFYNLGSRYNDIQYNVAMVEGSTLPDVVNGNLILMAHSGWAAISYFEYLYNLKIGDYAYVTYNGNRYSYKLVNIYDVLKNGTVKIVRNYDKTVLTLITCTRNNDKSQTVYILELV